MNREQMKAKLLDSSASQSWYKIKNLANGEVEISVYDEIGWFGVTAKDFMAELSAITAKRMNLRINSPGGEIFDGIAIANAIRSHAAYVTVYVDSLAASIASVIAMAGDGSGLCIGNASDMHQMAELLDRQSDNIAAVYAERAGGTVEEWRETMKAETWYTAQEAVDAGLADEMASIPRRTDPDEEEEDPPTKKKAATPFDPGALFREALVAAVEKPFEFDPNGFRESMASLITIAPAAPAPKLAVEPPIAEKPAELETELAPQPGVVVAETITAQAAVAPAVRPAKPIVPEPEIAEPEPEPEAPRDPWAEMRELMTTAIELEANRAPAPTQRSSQPDQGPASLDPWRLQQLLKEAATS
jgi:ATP-dependent protease ClpP protease subunit